MKKPTQPSLSIVTGQYLYILENERRGDYLGKTVQVVPHITDAMHEWIERVAAVPVDQKDGPADVCVIELGGTIGDIKLMPFIEALGQFSYRVGKQLDENVKEKFPGFAMFWYDQCISFRVALAKGMSWEDLARMVKEEKKSGNPVAGLIDKLHLERNCMTLLLSNNLDEMDDDEKTQLVDKI
nr:hypothetical protein Itr_chr11CG17720 [Ipomoea trifida]